jgi:glycosyltransferase involved in cell wall biosynthesis
MVFRNARAIIANTESAARRWREKFPWAADRIHVIWNGYDPENEITALPVPTRTQRHIVHAGNLYGNRNSNVILAGLARLRHRGHEAACSVRVVLAGPSDETSGIDQNLHRSAIAEGWLQADAKSVPQAEARQITREADGLLLLQPQSTVQVPAKLFEYMSIGRPVLALTPRDSSIEWILSRAGVPFVCVYSDDEPEVVDQKLIAYLALPNTPVPASDWFRTTFDAKRQTSQLAQIIDGLSTGP